MHMFSDFRFGKIYFFNFLLSVLLFQLPAFAIDHPSPATILYQDALGQIKGRVTGDLVGLGKVKVVLMQQEKIIDETLSDADGYFTFPYLNPGYYDLKGTKPGFRTSVTYAIPVTENETTTSNFYLPKFNNKHMARYTISEQYREPANDHSRDH